MSRRAKATQRAIWEKAPAKKRPRCICGHSWSRHRQVYGEPHTGPCDAAVQRGDLDQLDTCPCENYRPDVVL